MSKASAGSGRNRERAVHRVLSPVRGVFLGLLDLLDTRPPPCVSRLYTLCDGPERAAGFDRTRQWASLDRTLCRPSSSNGRVKSVDERVEIDGRRLIGSVLGHRLRLVCHHLSPPLVSESTRSGRRSPHLHALVIPCVRGGNRWVSPLGGVDNLEELGGLFWPGGSTERLRERVVRDRLRRRRVRQVDRPGS